MPSPPYKISSKFANQFKLCTHLSSLNVANFVIVEDTGLENMASWSRSMASHATKHRGNTPNDSKVIKGTQTDRIVIL
jgi:hypothetical protein